MGKRRPKQSELAAADEIRRQIKIATNKRDYKELANLYNQLGNQYRFLERYEEAIEAHQEEIDITNKYNKADKMGLGIAYRNMGEVYTDMKDVVESIRYINLYLKIAKDVGNLVEQQRAYITLGRAYISMMDEEESDQEKGLLTSKAALDKAESYYRNAYLLLTENELFEQLKDEKEFMRMKCNNCQNLGLALDSKGNHSDASLWLKKAIDLGTKYQFLDYIAPCYSVLCGIYLKTRKEKDALDTARKAAAAAIKIGNNELEVESTIMEAKALFLSDDVAHGKKILKRLRRKLQRKPELYVYKEEIDSLLVAAIKICRAQDCLLVTSSKDMEFVKLHEVLGDNYSTILNFESAVVHYKKACEHGEEIELQGKKLSRLYFSIAETYKDLENYSGALKYYIKEIELHQGNKAEEFKTQTNITGVLEAMKKPVEEVMKAHEVAISMAKATKSLSKEVTARSNFSVYLKNVGKGKEADIQNQILNTIKSENSIPETDDSQDLLDDNGDDDDQIDLDKLSDDSDDERDEDNNTNRKRCGGRVNEAGETKLHLAAKKGDLKAVSRLIKEGHPINTKDFAGWTALHEACNFGHELVVEELLKHKADVNDYGGACTEMLSPLHDSGYNGHCEVMKVLIKYGANVLLRDKQRNYPIDSLISWRVTTGKDCSEDELVTYREVKNLLKEKMELAGKPYSKEAESLARRKATKRRDNDSSPNTSLLVTKSRDYDCPIPVKISKDNYDPDEEGDGKRIYQDTMKQVRTNNRKVGPRGTERRRALSPGPRGALIPADKDVHENWLLPDDALQTTTRTSNPKRKRDPKDDLLFGDNDDIRGRKRSVKSREKTRDQLSSDEVENVIESMEIGSTTSSSSRQSQSSSPSQENEDIFNSMFENTYDPASSPLGDFLPSQRAVASTVEFGKTVDVPELIDCGSDSDDGLEIQNAFGSRRRQNRITKNKSKRKGISSSSDDESSLSFTNSRSSTCTSNGVKLSDVASTIKNSTNKFEISSSRKEKTLVQTRLPVKVIHNPKSSRLSDEFRRSRRSSSLELEVIPQSSNRLKLQNNNIPKKKEVWRLKVWIDGEPMLVPVEEDNFNESIDWLAAECAKRYSERHGVKPDLTLSTKDGAILSGNDSINLVLSADERELEAKVKRFDLPPLVDRYCSAAVSEDIEADVEIKSHLNMCQSSNVLNLTDVSLRGKIGVALITSLQRQCSLNMLILSGSSLFDSGVSELCKVLPTLSGLTYLDISSNGITKSGFMLFTEVFTKPSPESANPVSGIKVPLGITSLVLSHNPLGNFVGSSLASLLTKLSALKTLEVANCNFTEKLIAWSRNDLTKALINSRLEEIDISFNNLKDVGLEQILQSLPARRLRILNLSSCVANTAQDTTDGNRDIIAKPLCSFFSRNEDCCNLTCLQLNDCGLTDKSLELILDCFDRLVRLETLELTRNEHLTASSFTKLLIRIVDRDVPLTRLNMGNIPYMWNSSSGPTEEIILGALEKKMSSSKKLSYLKLSTSYITGKSNDEELSKLETRIIALMEDYAGNTSFSYKKSGACITYRFDV